jgi:hypothetical protein
MERAARSQAQVFALVIGVIYLVVGIVGLFFADGFTGGGADDKLVVFRLNHLHNIVHLVLGVVWIGASRTLAAAKTANAALGAVLLLVALLGFTGIDLAHTLLNIVSSTDADNFLHLVTGALGVYFGTAGAGDRERTTRVA